MELTLIITGAVAAVVLIGAIVLTVYDLKRKKGKMLNGPSISLGFLTIHATVEKIDGEANAEGLYNVEFKPDEGEAITVAVSKEILDGFVIGEAGELTLTDGLLTSFIPDGYTAEEEENA